MFHTCLCITTRHKLCLPQSLSWARLNPDCRTITKREWAFFGLDFRVFETCRVEHSALIYAGVQELRLRRCKYSPATRS